MIDIEIPYTIITVCVVGWLSMMLNELYIKNQTQENRIIRLSYNLQLAEYRSGYPYYSGISMKPMPYESQLLEMYRVADERNRRTRSKSL